MPFFDVNDESTKVDFMLEKLNEVLLILIDTGRISLTGGFSNAAKDYLINYLVQQFDELAYDDKQIMRIVALYIMGFELGVKETNQHVNKLQREGKIIITQKGYDDMDNHAKNQANIE
jgi:hypothetical protein